MPSERKANVIAAVNDLQRTANEQTAGELRERLQAQVEALRVALDLAAFTVRRGYEVIKAA